MVIQKKIIILQIINQLKTGIANKSSKEGESKGFGEVFEDKQNDIHPLRYYEGDTLVESRFGQSIRFSGYNNEDGTLSPTIILRNRENDVSQNDTEFGSTTNEDVNRDGSTIVLSSLNYKLDFQQVLLMMVVHQTLITNQIHLLIIHLS